MGQHAISGHPAGGSQHPSALSTGSMSWPHATGKNPAAASARAGDSTSDGAWTKAAASLNRVPRTPSTASGSRPPIPGQTASSRRRARQGVLGRNRAAQPAGLDQRAGLKPFVTAARTIRKRRTGILAAVRLGVNNARHEGLNRRVRLIVNRAYGFHSANAALGLIMLTLGPIEHVLPHERRRGSDP